MNDLPLFSSDGRRKKAERHGEEAGLPSPCGSFLCRLGENWLLYHPLEDRLLVLNATAKIVWDLLAHGRRAHEIASRFARDSAIPEEQAARDVDLVLADLTEGRPSGGDNRAGLWGEDPGAPGAGKEGPAECGAFRFGQSRIRVLSSVSELDGAFFSRFRHRALGNGSDELEISRDDCGYRLTFCGEIVAEAQTVSQTAARLVEFLLSLEHCGKPFLAFYHAAAATVRAAVS